jgi:hypothetical protein
MFEKNSKSNVLFNNFLQHKIMQESTASSPRPSKYGVCLTRIHVDLNGRMLLTICKWGWKRHSYPKNMSNLKGTA